MLRSILILITLLALAGLSSACGKDNKSEDAPGGIDSKTESYSFEFCNNCSEGEFPNTHCATTCSFGGCTTGKKQTSSFEGYCNVLKDNAANHFCEEETRRKTFQRASCTGTF